MSGWNNQRTLPHQYNTIEFVQEASLPTQFKSISLSTFYIVGFCPLFRLWDVVLWDSVLWDFVRRDFVLRDSVRIPLHTINENIWKVNLIIEQPITGNPEWKANVNHPIERNYGNSVRFLAKIPNGTAAESPCYSVFWNAIDFCRLYTQCGPSQCGPCQPSRFLPASPAFLREMSL